MTIAVLGLWALLLCAIAVRRPDWLLPAAVLCAPFEGAALVNASGVGVSPYFFTLILIAGRCVVVRTERSTLLGHAPRTRLAMGWMAATTVVAVAGAVVLPRVFAGAGVMSPRLDADAAAPLSFSTSNVAQAAYLLLNLGLLWYAAQTGDDDRTVHSMVVAMRSAGAIVLGLAVYQFAASYTGLPYPEDVLYSNTAYVMMHGTSIMDLPRLCSTFTEPAGMAVFLVGYLMFLAAEPPSRRRGAIAIRMSLIGTTIGVLALSTSSTAYVGLAGAAAWATARFLAVPLITGARRNPRAAAAVVLMTIVAVAAVASSETLRELLRKMVFEKDESSSYDERAGADAFATGLFKSTWGLGVGLGSNRASSFGPSLLSTVGLFGVAGLGGALIHLLRSPDRRATGPAAQWHAPFAAGLLGVVGTKMVSSPDLVTPSMWSLMAALLCVHGAAATAPSDDACADETVEPEPHRRATLGMTKAAW